MRVSQRKDLSNRELRGLGRSRSRRRWRWPWVSKKRLEAVKDFIDKEFDEYYKQVSSESKRAMAYEALYKNKAELVRQLLRYCTSLERAIKDGGALDRGIAVLASNTPLLISDENITVTVLQKPENQEYIAIQTLVPYSVIAGLELSGKDMIVDFTLKHVQAEMYQFLKREGIGPDLTGREHNKPCGIVEKRIVTNLKRGA